MNFVKSLFFLMIFCLLPSLLFSQAGAIQIINLKTEYTSTPLGIDVRYPRFSWQMESVVAGSYQTAYQVTASDENGHLVWDSGKKANRQSLNIKYAGEPLMPGTRYNWTVHVWDQAQKEHSSRSWFETGLMDTDGNLSGWSGAKWIGGADEDMLLYAQYLPVFKIDFTVQLDQTTGSSHAGLIYGANDGRLMDKNKNYFGLAGKRDSSFIFIELDIAPLNSGESALVNVYRAGYKPGDRADKPLKSFKIPRTIINDQNKYTPHTLYLSSVMGYTEIYVDGEEKNNLIAKTGLNPLGQGGDFIAYPVLGYIGFRAAEQQSANFSKLHVRNYRSPSNILYSAYPSPLKLSSTTRVSMILTDPSRNASPMLRTTFSTLSGKIKKARLYVTARGIYDVYLNGSRVGEDYFNPGLTQYNKTQMYQTFDVTGKVSEGKNAIGAVLSEGWWSGGSTYMGDFWNFFGDRQSLLAKLVITYENGKNETIVSDPGTWKYFSQGPLVYGSFFQGEVYDARKEAAIKDWSTPAFNESRWTKATEVGLTRHISLDARNKAANMPMVDDYSKLAIIGQIGETVRKVNELKAIAVEEVRPGVYIYDMGQNMAGVPKISLKNYAAGKQIKLRFAEVKYPDMPEYKANTGMIMLENIRAAMAQEIYITRGGYETISPRFTYHGFRYIEITGIDKPLALTAVRGIVLSSVHQLKSGYETSNPAVNKLWKNINWSMLANFMSIPTDCPQRNERLGWSGDISVFSRTATYLATLPQFLRRHMLAMRDVQREDGRFTDVAPLGGGFGDTLWGSAGISVAWESYLQYGDLEMLAEHYNAMSHYLDFLISQIDPKTYVLDDKNRSRWASLGDWLSPEYDRTEKSLLWEAYFIADIEKMGKIAALLGKSADADRFEKLSRERKTFFNDTYLDKTNGKTAFREKDVDTQTSYAVPLGLNLFEDKLKSKVIENFAATIKRENISDQGKVMPPYSLMTGFIGTAWISTALSNSGKSDLAYRQLQQVTYPSWLYPVTQGATTIWERLNSYTHANGFGGNNNMNSFNHYSFGAVGSWMIDHSLGILRDENSPGFQHFFLSPEPDPTGKMTFAKGHYNSMYGKIESSWKLTNRKFTYHFHVPANTSATLMLKAEKLQSIREGDKIISTTSKARYKGKQNDRLIFELLPGDYDFKVNDFLKIME